MCEIGFSIIKRSKTKFQNKLQLLNFLSLKMTSVYVDVKAIIKIKKAHSLHIFYSVSKK